MIYNQQQRFLMIKCKDSFSGNILLLNKEVRHLFRIWMKDVIKFCVFIGVIKNK